jgi:hypothetical protein
MAGIMHAFLSARKHSRFDIPTSELSDAVSTHWLLQPSSYASKSLSHSYFRIRWTDSTKKCQRHVLPRMHPLHPQSSIYTDVIISSFNH